MGRHYREYSEYLAQYFDVKVQKLTVNAGLGCPNRDGTLGRGGCIYCNNSSFNPGHSHHPAPVRDQIAQGKQFFARKYPEMKYLAYFQAYTGTYGSIDRLLSLYDEALRQDDVVGLIIGTRPDCMPQTLLDELATLRRQTFVMVEYGAESSHNATLQRINRCHTWEQTVDAVCRTADAGIDVGLHLIMGLPDETEPMMLQTIDAVNALPVSVVKLHQLQLLRGTLMAREVEEGRCQSPSMTVEEYLRLCAAVIKRLRKDIAIERFVSSSPSELLIAPRWGLKNYEFVDKLRHYLQ